MFSGSVWLRCVPMVVSAPAVVAFFNFRVDVGLFVVVPVFSLFPLYSVHFITVGGSRK